MKRVGTWVAATFLGLAIASSPSTASAAVEPEANVDIGFVDGCSGSGYWFLWDAVLYPDPLTAPGWESGSGLHPVTWSPEAPIRITAITSGPVEPQRKAFLLLGSDKETRLFQALFQAQPDPGGDFALAATLDCATTPYRIVSTPDSAMAKPSNPMPVAIGWLLVVSAALTGAIQLNRLQKA